MAPEAGVGGQALPEFLQVARKFRLRLGRGRHEGLREPQEKGRGGEDQRGVEAEQEPQDGRPEGRAHPVGKPHHLRRLVDDEQDEEKQDDGAHRERRVLERADHASRLLGPLPFFPSSDLPGLSLSTPDTVPRTGRVTRSPARPVPPPSSR